MISVSENFLVESVFFFFTKIRSVPSQHKVLVSTLASFYEAKLNQLPYSVLQLRERNSCVESREVKWFNAIVITCSVTMYKGDRYIVSNENFKL